jgi:hypothetical protein
MNKQTQAQDRRDRRAHKKNPSNYAKWNVTPAGVKWRKAFNSR